MEHELMRLVLLDKLRLWQKLALLVAAMSLPAVLVGFFYLRSAGDALSQARAELAGSDYLRALGNLYADVAIHEQRAYALASGDAASAPAVRNATARTDAALARLARIDARLGKRFGVRRDYRATAAEWHALAAAGPATLPARVVAAHQRLLARLARLASAVAVGSRVTADPNQRTRSLMEIASEYVPAALGAEADLRRYAVDAAAKGYLGGGDRTGIAITHTRLLADFSAIKTALEAEPARVRGPLRAALATATTAADRFYRLVARRIIDAKSLKIPTATLYADGTGERRALSALLDTSGTAAAHALSAEISALRTAREVNIALVLLAIALIQALTWTSEHSLTSPLRRVIAVFDRIAAGHYDSDIDAHRGDELGQVLHALQAMQSQLRTQLDNERLIAAENSRIRQALDKTSTGVLLADAEHRIVYLNEAAQAGFAAHADALRAVLPGFDAARLRGARMDCLASAPAEERRALDALRGERIEDRSFGRFDFRVTTNPVLARNGERLGTVMEWRERTQEVAVEREMQAVLAAVTADDLTRRIELDGKRGFFAALGTGVNRLAENLAAVVSRVKATAREIALGAEEITQGNSNLSSRTEEQAASLEQTASSMEQMTTTVKQTADNAAEANQLALAARTQAEQGVAVVDKTVTAVTGIDESARKIADIIGVIDAIAFQTNLLALNAAVEAARAGEQGRGFAVVASEVRNLAGRSASAAKEITSLIRDSVAKVADGSRLVGQSGQTLGEIVASVKTVSDIVAEIAAAAREQSAGIEQVNRAVIQMDQITQQNAALVQETISASRVMTGQVRNLNETLERFRLAGGLGPAANPTVGSAPVTDDPAQLAVAAGDGR